MGNIREPRLTRDNDLSKTAESMESAIRMTESLQAGSNDMAAHFYDDFRWIANTGCGRKNGLDEFRRNWQLPLRAAFSVREYIEEARLAQGEWVSGFGFDEATLSGDFWGIAPCGVRGRMP